MSRTRHRAWAFTLNNYSDDDRQRLERIVDSGIGKYVCYQPERSPSTGTPHIQGYVVFTNARTFGGARGIVGSTAHIEVARGSCEQNVDYCSKEDSRDTEAGFGFIEFGDRDAVQGTGCGSGSRTDLAIVAKRLRDGATVEEVAQDHAASFIMYTRGICSFAQLVVPKRAHKSIVYWYWGPTGTGKTRAASEESPDAYWKSSAHQWYDGYDGLSDIIIDDYRPSFSTFNELLRLLDRYPYQAQIKGGTVQVNAKRIFITAPKCPADMWSSRTEEDLAQLIRRIEHVKHFKPNGNENNPEPVLIDPGIV
jgi:hypothetical protein